MRKNILNKNKFLNKNFCHIYYTYSVFNIYINFDYLTFSTIYLICYIWLALDCFKLEAYK